MIPQSTSISLANIPSDSMKLLSLEGQEKRDALFSYKARIRFDRTLPPAAILQQPIALQFRSETTDVIHAMVGEIETQASGDYCFTLVPHFAMLQEKKETRTFLHQTVLEIFSAICSRYPGLHYDLSYLTQKNFPSTWAFQYQETDWDFLQRLFQKNGLFFYFEQRASACYLILGNDSNAYSPLDPPPTLFKTSFESTCVTADTETPVHVGGIMLFNKTYWVLMEVDYRYAFPPSLYTFHLRAIPLENSIIAFSSAHGMQGPLIAKVIASAFTEKTSNARGEVQVQFLVEDATEPLTSDWLPVLQTAAGTMHILQFIPRVGDNVLVHFVEGDADQPVVIDHLQNFPIFSLPDEKNKMGLRTPAQHEFSLDSTENHEAVLLHSKGGYSSKAEYSFTETLKGDQRVSIYSGDYSVRVEKEAVIASKQKIVLQNENNKIVIEPNKITVHGKKIDFFK